MHFILPKILHQNIQILVHRIFFFCKMTTVLFKSKIYIYIFVDFLIALWFTISTYTHTHQILKIEKCATNLGDCFRMASKNKQKIFLAKGKNKTKKITIFWKKPTVRFPQNDYRQSVDLPATAKHDSYKWMVDCWMASHSVGEKKITIKFNNILCTNNQKICFLNLFTWMKI